MSKQTDVDELQDELVLLSERIGELTAERDELHRIAEQTTKRAEGFLVERDRLREALERILTTGVPDSPRAWFPREVRVKRIARSALSHPEPPAYTESVAGGVPAHEYEDFDDERCPRCQSDKRYNLWVSCKGSAHHWHDTSPPPETCPKCYSKAKTYIPVDSACEYDAPHPWHTSPPPETGQCPTCGLDERAEPKPYLRRCSDQWHTPDHERCPSYTKSDGRFVIPHPDQEVP